MYVPITKPIEQPTEADLLRATLYRLAVWSDRQLVDPWADHRNLAAQLTQALDALRADQAPPFNF